ncbi:MAG: L,D-transpeptidase family protein [Sulfuricurvum sp.]|uniref:L,D-transpeptidase family protein n=1 Tax=Sulfuricurvum sp. TaxID=2025608 RepID=UPI0026391697|nr:L,D-transpeptidase family protein [Sulfuricurvum sp.]MDD2828918.1 L,D-transpeptidase family protein [Sulfuricurvum sp.]MDD4948581.1 L,D-transpeptidase family protein [Sulfuricurvum sp.]
MDLYRQGGMAAIQKEIDHGFGDRTFWKEKLAQKDLQFGYYESTNTLLICEKNQPSLSLYRKDNKERFTRIKTIPAFTGKFEGDKMNAGDRRTPIGVYTLTEKRENVDQFYGPMAFVTSYPNLYDRIRGKNGDGIWIHGVPISGDRDSFTKGCIAIDNGELTNLDQNINYKNLFLIIDTKTKTYGNVAYDAIISQLYQWRYAWKYNDLQAYLSFYDTTFVRFDGMEYFDFKNYKQRIFERKETKEIFFTNLNIIPYPGDRPNLFMVTFDEVYTSDKHNFTGPKILMLLLNSDNSISIISEQ